VRLTLTSYLWSGTNPPVPASDEKYVNSGPRASFSAKSNFSSPEFICLSDGKDCRRMLERMREQRVEHPNFNDVSDRMIDRNPSAYPLLRRRVESRTLSDPEISSSKRSVQSVGSLLSDDSESLDKHDVAISWSALWAAKAAPACFKDVNVLIKRAPARSTRENGALNPSAVIVAATAAHVSFVKSQDPT
jgi:hypothetical protein